MREICTSGSVGALAGSRRGYPTNLATIASQPSPLKNLSYRKKFAPEEDDLLPRTPYCRLSTFVPSAAPLSVLPRMIVSDEDQLLGITIDLQENVGRRMNIRVVRTRVAMDETG